MYTPRYVTDLSEIPVQIPDDYSDKQKTDALEVAESTAELDLNDGERLDTADTIPSSIMQKVKTAIKQKATAELAEGAEDPTDIQLGDINDDGTTKQDYAEQFDSEYDRLIRKIQNSDALDDTRDDSAYVYTTGGY